MNRFGDYQHIRFHIGDNIICRTTATEVYFGIYDRYKIVEISGSGAMYSSVNDYVAEYYDPNSGAWIEDRGTTWSNFIATTMSFSSEPVISQGDIEIPNGVTSVSARFLYNLVFDSLVLPEGLVSIGDGAFAGEIYNNLNYHTTNQITSLVIPSTVTHIGRAAFIRANRLVEIIFRNENYTMETYGELYSENEIFYVSLYAGSNLDDNGYLITNIVGNNSVRAYDWYNKCHRKWNQSVAGYIYVYSSLAMKKIELPVYNTVEDIGVYFSSIDAVRWLKLVDVNDAHASPVRVYTSNNGIMAISFE